MSSEISVSSTIESRIESVDAAEERVRRFASDSGVEEEDQYFISLAAREILINAVKHGNHFDRNKKVLLRLIKTSDSMAIEVTDEGDGFQVEGVPNPHAEENRERRSGRGLALAMAIMDEFVVTKKLPHGTHVRMVKHFVAS